MTISTDELLKRIERLEQAVFSETKTPSLRNATPSGPTRGILELISDGFFTAPNRRSLKEVMTALIAQGKDYSRQAVNIALKRLSHGKKAVLIRHADKKETNYVKRG